MNFLDEGFRDINGPLRIDLLKSEAFVRLFHKHELGLFVFARNYWRDPYFCMLCEIVSMVIFGWRYRMLCFVSKRRGGYDWLWGYKVSQQGFGQLLHSFTDSEYHGYGYTRGFWAGFSHRYGHGYQNLYPPKTRTRGLYPPLCLCLVLPVFGSCLLSTFRCPFSITLVSTHK